LYRHPQLDPGDVYINKNDRELLRLLVEVEGEAAREVVRRISQVRRAEVEQKMAEGGAKVISSSGSGMDPLALAVEQAKTGVTISKRGGQLYMVPTAELTESSALTTDGRVAGQEFGANFIYWFVGLGLCPEPNSQQLLLSLFEER